MTNAEEELNNLCTHQILHSIGNKTSGYATWFTAGGAIRIAH